MKNATTAISLILASMLAPSGADAADPPRAVTVARTTDIPKCTVFVDAASKNADGTVNKPHTTIAAAIEAIDAGAVICVAQGVYAEKIEPGEKFFTLAGGFQSGSGFKVRDSAKYVSKAKGSGKGSFLRIEDPGPVEGLTAIDGFEITGYSQAIVRAFYLSQHFEITNNFIHDNTCSDQTLAGAGFALDNVSGAIRGNVIKSNSCGRGGAGFLNDATNQNTVLVERNLIDGNSGTEPDSAHGGGLYLFGNKLHIVGNMITNNTVTQWGGGLFVGAFTQGNQPTTATLSWNVYRGNRAGNSGGGFFCDDGATCNASHEVYDSNCGGNVMVDAGPGGSDPTRATFDQVTNFGARAVGCGGPGIGAYVNTYEGHVADTYAFTNSIFWGNAAGKDLATACGTGCSSIKVSVSTSLVQKTYAKDGGIIVTFGAGNIDSVDPQFAAPDQGDFRLRPGSPASGKARGGGDLGAYGAGGDAGTEKVVAKSEPAAPPAAKPAKPAVEPPPTEVTETVPSPTAPAPQKAAQQDDASTKDAFNAAKELGTIKAWNAFLQSYPTGFHANLARAYLDKLGDGAAAPAAVEAASPEQADGPQVALGPNASLGGRRLLPDDSHWHKDISQDPVDPNSERILARVGMDKPLRADFGPEWEGAPTGIPYVVVSGAQPRVPATFLYADESDPGPYPIPPDAPIEGGPNGTGDRHILVLDRDNWILWEVFNAFPDGKGGWKTDGGAVWDLKQNQVRPAGWTSADAAGLPILPGLVRYDEAVEKKAIEHALRFTLAKSRRAYVPPASHWASKFKDEDLPPMGMRVRLKADYDVSSFAPEVQAILTALKKYGMILADNGSDNFISGVPDERWDVDMLRQLMRVKTKDLEVVEMTGIVIDKR